MEVTSTRTPGESMRNPAWFPAARSAQASLAKGREVEVRRRITGCHRARASNGSTSRCLMGQRASAESRTDRYPVALLSRTLLFLGHFRGPQSPVTPVTFSRAAFTGTMEADQGSPWPRRTTCRRLPSCSVLIAGFASGISAQNAAPNAAAASAAPVNVVLAGRNAGEIALGRDRCGQWRPRRGDA